MEVFIGIVIIIIILIFVLSIFSGADSLYYNLSGQNARDIADKQHIDVLWDNYIKYLDMFFNTENQELKNEYLNYMNEILTTLESDYNHTVFYSRKMLDELNEA